MIFELFVCENFQQGTIDLDPEFFQLLNSPPDNDVVFLLLEPPIFGSIYLTYLSSGEKEILTEGMIYIK